MRPCRCQRRCPDGATRGPKSATLVGARPGAACDEGASVTREALEVTGVSVGLIALGLSVVAFVSVERTRTNVAFAGGTLAVGGAIGTVSFFVGHVDAIHPGVLPRIQAIFEVAAIVMYGRFLLEVLASSAMAGRREMIVRWCGWATIGLAGWHAIASAVWPAQRLNEYELGLGRPDALSHSGFWLFAGFWLVLAAPYAVGWGLLAAGGLDRAEARRAQAAVIASVAAIAATAAPPDALPAVLAAWICLSLYGQVQYVGAHARRAVFLGRFLSPRVTELIASRGFEETMKPHNADLTVICADLRGFTSYSEGVPSQGVVNLLAEYYDACGEVVARHGGTITNYAGDGVLILVGAPVPVASHAATGVQLAHDLRIAVDPVLDRVKTPMHRLGLGIGVATGNVMVGAISAQTRMEYTAIGMPVNLAARLCARAAAGEVLLDAETASRAGIDNIESQGHFEIKGFSGRQEVFALVDT